MLNITINHAENAGEHMIKNSRYRTDGYCVEKNTIFEFNGCYYHGCVKCYENQDDMNHTTQCTFGELYNKTGIKKKHILRKGYQYIEVWECGWKKIRNSDDLMQTYLNEMSAKLNIKCNVDDIDDDNSDIYDIDGNYIDGNYVEDIDTDGSNYIDDIYIDGNYIDIDTNNIDNNNINNNDDIIDNNIKYTHV